MFVKMNDIHNNVINTRNITFMSKKSKEEYGGQFDGIIIGFNGSTVAKWFEYVSKDNRDKAYTSITGYSE